ncbi:MAG: hypothetical protein K940chlam2_00092 [Chlamydiae bacterium]|nr:hypothetical protein [Chlamydiota bacterium]
MIDGINKSGVPFTNSTNSPFPPTSRLQQADKSTLSSDDSNQRSCGQILWTAVKVLFFPITLTYLFFKNLCSSSEIDITKPSNASFSVYGAPYPEKARHGPHITTVAEANGHPMQFAADESGRGKKVAVLVDAKREQKVLIPQLQLHRLLNKGMEAVEQRDALVWLENLTCSPEALDSVATVKSPFSANLIIAQSTPYPKATGNYILESKFTGFDGEQINHLRSALRGQLFLAEKRGVEVLVLDHFGSHQGTPSEIIRTLYNQLLRDEFAGCFQKVIFVKRGDDDAPRATAAELRRTAASAVQLKDLKS